MSSGVVTAEKIEAKIDALKTACNEVEQIVRCGENEFAMIFLRFKKGAYDNTTTVSIGANASLSVRPPEPRFAYPVLTEFVKHTAFETRFYLNPKDITITSPTKWDEVEPYLNNLNQLAQHIDNEEGLHVRLRTKVFESISDALSDFEVQLGKFHLLVLEENGPMKRATELVNQINANLHELGGISYGINIRQTS